MDDRSLFTMLSTVKGIGSCSVHMFMIFSLHHPDALPVSDLGVSNGVQLLDELLRPSQMEQLCVKWRPYRSVGAWYMWRFVEGKGGGWFGGEWVFGSAGNRAESSNNDSIKYQLQLLEPLMSIGNLG